MKKICVFCGSSPGKRPEYLAAATALGEMLAQNEIGLVYGGASVGLMGAVARAVMDGGGHVTGVIPEALKSKEVAFEDLADLRVVDSMHARKALMAELADGFIALPGGLGTLEEFVEVLTWSQLDFHRKPCGLLNLCSYYEPFLQLIDQMADQQFINPLHRQLIITDASPEELLRKMQAFRPPVLDKAKWVLKLNGVDTEAA